MSTGDLMAPRYYVKRSNVGCVCFDGGYRAWGGRGLRQVSGGTGGRHGGGVGDGVGDGGGGGGGCGWCLLSETERLARVLKYMYIQYVSPAFFFPGT